MEENAEPTTPRRSIRHRAKPNKFGEFIEHSLPNKEQELYESCSEDEDRDSECKEDSPQRPTALFSGGDIGGQDIFKFKTRHTLQDLQNKVNSAIQHSPKLSVTPKKTPKNKIAGKYSPLNKGFCGATPRHVTDIIKKRIIREIESDSDDSDFSASSSDFVPDHSEAETNTEDDSQDTDEEEIEIPKNNKVNARSKKDMKTKLKQGADYMVTPDNYFTMHSNRKITTSNHTLQRLKNLSIDENEQTKDAAFYISEEHKKKIEELSAQQQLLFDKWFFILSEDFSIVLYGVGSKSSILEKFQIQKLGAAPCVVVNGFFPGLTIKSIIEAIVVDVLKCSQTPNNVTDIVDLIDKELTEKCVDLFLIVHNIDGVAIRNRKAQATLASIAQIKNVHLIASIDHIHAPLLWDHAKLCKFRFTWWDATSFLPYARETAYEGSAGVRRGGAAQLAALRSVYRALTDNARGVYRVLVRHQLSEGHTPHYQGLPFKDLYAKCREQFLVSSDVALRTQLTEFLDHKLVRTKRTFDAGGENLVIPIDNALLEQFMEEQDEALAEE